MRIRDNTEEISIKQRTIVLDTSSMNQLLKNENLLNLFFDKASNLNAIVAIPPKVLSEISNNDKIFDNFKNIYQKKECLKIIQEIPFEIMKREIENPIESYLYLEKNNIDIFSNIKKGVIEKTKKYNQKMKKGWKKTYQGGRKDFSKKFLLTSEKRNKEIEEKLKTGEHLKNYIKEGDYWTLYWFKKEININFSETEIHSNRSRYKYINLFQCLMFISMVKTLISGKSVLSSKQGDLFDMAIASYSAFSYCFISEDKGQVKSLQIIKDISEEFGFENKCKVYHKIEDFIR